MVDAIGVSRDGRGVRLLSAGRAAVLLRPSLRRLSSDPSRCYRPGSDVAAMDGWEGSAVSAVAVVAGETKVSETQMELMSCDADAVRAPPLRIPPSSPSLSPSFSPSSPPLLAARAVISSSVRLLRSRSFVLARCFALVLFFVLFFLLLFGFGFDAQPDGGRQQQCEQSRGRRRGGRVQRQEGAAPVDSECDITRMRTQPAATRRSLSHRCGRMRRLWRRGLRA